MNKKAVEGYTLFELFMALVIIAIVTGILVPLVMYVIKVARINAFKSDAYSVLEAVKIHIATANFDNIPDEGIEIEKLNIELKNNNFESGVVKKIGTDKFEIIDLKKANYCARGTFENMKVSDKGCGSLDVTAPTNARLYVKEYGDEVVVIAGADDSESNIVGYEFSLDNKKYTKKTGSNEYSFKNDYKKHVIRVRVTNESGLTTESSDFNISDNYIPSINCIEKDSMEYFQSSKNIVCKYPVGNYTYQYSYDLKNWNRLDVIDGTYNFNIKNNKTIYTRVLLDKKVVSFHTINTSNIDNVLDDAYPDLLENMIPVIYDDINKTWIKADSRLKYFDYENKLWANAVFVRRSKDTDDPNSQNREYYLSSYAIGKPIYEKDIIAHFVWIPRFKYKIFNLSDVNKEESLIDVVFENNSKVTSSAKIGEYQTHKAFLYDNSNGFWVGKYQTSISNTSSCYSDQSMCNKDDLILYINKSDKKLSNISISNAHLSVQKMKDKANIYGLASDAKPHVLTNLEYGAILYLTNSIYGIGLDKYTYSTTSNMSGVFDLNTDNPEMVMANYNKDSGLNALDNSGFEKYGKVKWPSFIDYYVGITSKNRILGDATGETNGWYDSYASFVNGSNPFFIRGGVINEHRSIYNYSSFTGSNNPSYSFRVAFIK